MSIPPNLSQRDLVRLAILVCATRNGEKQRPASKGTHHVEPSRGYDR
jgi:hypothetical protein